MSSETGYGPSHTLPNIFDGNERNYEKWEIKFLAQLKLLNLKDVIHSSDYDAPDVDKKEMAYAIYGFS